MMTEICGMTPEGFRIAAEHFRIACERCDTFLNTGTARIVKANHWRTDAHRHIHDLADLLRMGFRKREPPSTVKSWEKT